MLISTSRQKLVNAVVYFARNTQYCGKVKLFKLLYLLDFAHFRETGRSVTGMEYLAWKLGPVPLELEQEWDQLEADLGASVEIRPAKVIDYTREEVVARVEFDESPFTKRELRIMAELAARFRDEKSRPLINITHSERGHWDKIWDSGRGNNVRIPYSLAVPDDAPNRDAILEAAREYEAMASGNSRPH